MKICKGTITRSKTYPNLPSLRNGIGEDIRKSLKGSGFVTGEDVAIILESYLSDLNEKIEEMRGQLRAHGVLFP